MDIVRAATPETWSAGERLIREYAGSLGVSLEFQHFADEIGNLAGEYGAPHGVLLLARDDDGYIGCGGIRRFSADVCEMKRLYVRPAAQGRGAGRAIAAALIAEARAIGYLTLRLDTLPSMRGARALYRSLGFREIAPYRFNPVAGTTYMELSLSGRGASVPGPGSAAPPAVPRCRAARGNRGRPSRTRGSSRSRRSGRSLRSTVSGREP